MIVKLIRDYLLTQDPHKTHNLVTRILVSGIILFSNLVLYGFYGVMGAIIVFLGLSWFNLSKEWALAPLFIAGLVALWKGFLDISDYWQNYGH